MTRDEVEARISKLNSIRLRHRQAQSEADRFDGWIDRYPFWAWVKRYETHRGVGLYRMLRFSHSYGLDLVGPQFDAYRGKFDHEFWPVETAAVFHRNDEKVRTTMFNHGAVKDKDIFEVRERFTSPIDGRVYDFIGEKWAYAANDEILIAGRGRGVLVGASRGQDDGQIG